MPLFPPPSATLMWTLHTPHDDVQCFAWRSPQGWRAGVYFGADVMELAALPGFAAVQFWAAAVRMALTDVGFGGEQGLSSADAADGGETRASADPAPASSKPRLSDAS